MNDDLAVMNRPAAAAVPPARAATRQRAPVAAPNFGDKQGAQVAAEAGAEVAAHVAAETASPLLGRLLKMARQYLAQGQQRRAMEMLWELVEDHGGTHQASAARDALQKLEAPES